MLKADSVQNSGRYHVAPSPYATE